MVFAYSDFGKKKIRIDCKYANLPQKLTWFCGFSVT